MSVRSHLGANGGLTSAIDPGEACARTIVQTGMPGASAPMTTPGARSIAGAKTALQEFATVTSCSSLRSRFGMAAILSSRNACSGLLPTKETTARTSRTIGSTSTTRQPTATCACSTNTRNVNFHIDSSLNRTREVQANPNSNFSIPGSSTMIAISTFLSSTRRNLRKTSASGSMP